MTVTNAQRGVNTSYGLGEAVPINIDELIYMISPDDSPLINGINSDGRQILSVAPVDNTQFDWLDEERLTPSSTIASTLADGVTTIDVAAGDGEKFGIGDLVEFHDPAAIYNGEIARVTGVSNDTLTLDRDFGGTENLGNVTYASGSAVVSLGILLDEGANPEAARSADRTKRYNYTQTHGPEKVEMTRTEQGRRKYGIANEWSHQLMNRMVEQVIRRERGLLYGVRYDSGSATTPRISGGINYWITDNVDSASTDLTIAALQAQMQACYEAGGIPDTLTARPTQLDTLNDPSNSDGLVQTVFEDRRRGRVPVLSVHTEFGVVTVLRNRYCASTTAFLFNRGQATRRVFDPVTYTRLAKTGDSDSAMIVCEEGLEFKGQQHAAKFTFLGTS